MPVAWSDTVLSNAGHAWAGLFPAEMVAQRATTKVCVVDAAFRVDASLILIPPIVKRLLSKQPDSAPSLGAYSPRHPRCGRDEIDRSTYRDCPNKPSLPKVTLGTVRLPVLEPSCRWLATNYCSPPNGKRQVRQSTHRLEPRPRDLIANSRAPRKPLR